MASRYMTTPYAPVRADFTSSVAPSHSGFLQLRSAPALSASLIAGKGSFESRESSFVFCMLGSSSRVSIKNLSNSGSRPCTAPHSRLEAPNTDLSLSISLRSSECGGIGMPDGETATLGPNCGPPAPPGDRGSAFCDRDPSGGSGTMLAGARSMRRRPRAGTEPERGTCRGCESADRHAGTAVAAGSLVTCHRLPQPAIWLVLPALSKPPGAHVAPNKSGGPSGLRTIAS
mmetsp:Transcript_91671/g.238945  ORF Transcript_91671/g.238945 Transcript_91671/m.238945 type:complete len:230 (-) Transcript_91671:259-948(-)